MNYCGKKNMTEEIITHHVEKSECVIAVFSDSHGNIPYLHQAAKAAAPYDMAVHLGDYCRDASALRELDTPVFCVSGNNDFSKGVPAELLIDICGIKIYCTHGHQWGIKVQNDRLFCKAKELGANIALYGHTHASALDNIGGILLLNPGSVSMPRGGRTASFARLRIVNGAITPQICLLRRDTRA